MLDYMSQFSGPSKNEANKLLQGDFKASLLNKYKHTAPINYQVEINTIINNSILEGIESINPGYPPDKDNFAGSQAGWAVFGYKDTIAKIDDIITIKIKSLKKEKGKKIKTKIINQANIPDAENISRYIENFLH
jgi:hypothetical protein